jgi:hypothetical protein
MTASCLVYSENNSISCAKITKLSRKMDILISFENLQNSSNSGLSIKYIHNSPMNNPNSPSTVTVHDAVDILINKSTLSIQDLISTYAPRYLFSIGKKFHQFQPFLYNNRVIRVIDLAIPKDGDEKWCYGFKIDKDGDAGDHSNLVLGENPFMKTVKVKSDENPFVQNVAQNLKRGLEEFEDNCFFPKQIKPSSSKTPPEGYCVCLNTDIYADYAIFQDITFQVVKRGKRWMKVMFVGFVGRGGIWLDSVGWGRRWGGGKRRRIRVAGFVFLMRG